MLVGQSTKTKHYSQTWKYCEQPYDVTQKSCSVITQWDVVSVETTIKKNYSQAWKYNKKNHDATQNNWKWLTPWSFVPLRLNIKQTIIQKHENKINNISTQHENFARHQLNGPLYPLGKHLPTQLQTWRTWETSLNPINILMVTGEITKTGTLATALHKHAVETNTYDRFIYSPLSILYHTWGQVSGSMNDNPIKMIPKSQQSTKQGFNR